MQDKELSGVRSEGSSPDRGDGRIRYSILRPELFLFHNAHLQSGDSWDAKRCRICSGRLAKDSFVAEGEARRDVVDESGGDDKEGATAPAYNTELWKALSE